MLIYKLYSIFLKANSLFLLPIYKKIFMSNCIKGKKFSCGYMSRCFNNSKNIKNITIGDNCEIFAKLQVEGTGKIVIGDFTTLRYGTYVLSINLVEIGNYVIISNNVTIYDNNNHPTSPEKRIAMSRSGFNSNLWSISNSENSKVKICDNVWIGEKAIILKGVTIGEGSIVATGAVVTKNVPPLTIVAGNPAKVVKYL